MNKKGEALPLNVVIVAILVVLVLIVVAVFFLGGTAGISSTIRQIFRGTTGGTDLTLAIETCRTKCTQIQQSITTEAGFLASGYCKTYYNIDENGDGEAEIDTSVTTKKVYKKYYCDQTPISVSC